MECLTTEEIQKLTDLLEKIHDINLLPKRNTLLSGLPQWLLNKVSSSDDTQVHLTNIVNTFGDEMYFKMEDGSYPIVTVIQNAQREAGKTRLRENLQEYLEHLCNRYNIMLKKPLLFLPETNPIVLSTAVLTFQRELEGFIQEVELMQEQLHCAYAAFASRVLLVKSMDVSKQISDLSDPIVAFTSSLQLSNTTLSVVIAHGGWLTKDIECFKNEAQTLLTSIQHFCHTYGSALEQPREKREDIQQQIVKLKQRCTSMLEEARKLRGKIDDQAVYLSEQSHIS